LTKKHQNAIIQHRLTKQEFEMAQFVVREVEWGGDVDGTGPERWMGREMGRFGTEDEAVDFIDTQWTECEVVEE
jgi:hypothetical protein